MGSGLGLLTHKHPVMVQLLEFLGCSMTADVIIRIPLAGPVSVYETRYAPGIENDRALYGTPPARVEPARIILDASSTILEASEYLRWTQENKRQDALDRAAALQREYVKEKIAECEVKVKEAKNV